MSVLGGTWMWDAGHWLGVADGPEAAQLAAAEHLEPGRAARVEFGVPRLSEHLDLSYRRSGIGWTGTLDEAGTVRWVSLESEFTRAWEAQLAAYDELTDGRLVRGDPQWAAPLTPTEAPEDRN